MTPLAGAPVAHADDFGLGELIGYAASAVDPSAAAGVDPGDLAGVLDGAAGSNFLFNLINLPTQELFGVNLVGSGTSIGDTFGLLGQTWDGHNTAPLAFLSFGMNVGDGGILFGTGGTGGAGGTPGGVDGQPGT